MVPWLHRDQLRQRRLEVGANRQGHGLVLVQLGTVDVDMDDLAVFDELADHAGYPVIETHAQGEHQVRLVDGNIGVLCAVHAEHVQAQRDVREGMRPGP